MCILSRVIQCDSELKYVIFNKYLQIPPAFMQVKFYPLNEDAQFLVRNTMTSLKILGKYISDYLMIFGTIVKRYRKLS